MNLYNKMILALSDKKFKKSLILVLLSMLIYYAGSFVLLPNVNKELAPKLSEMEGGAQMLFALTGSQISALSIFTIGVGPLLTSGIILQMGSSTIFPGLKEMQQSGKRGRSQFRVIMMSFAFILSIIQSVSMTYSFAMSGVLVNSTMPGFAITTISMILGVGSLMVIDEILKRNDFEHGISVFIATGILMSLPTQTLSVYLTLKMSYPELYVLFFSAYILMYVLIVYFIFKFSNKSSKIPMVSSVSGTVKGRGKTATKKTYLPLGWNLSGVMPIIISSAVIQFPSLAYGWIFKVDPSTTWMMYIGLNRIAGLILYAVLIYYFTFLYNKMTLNPKEISEDFKKSGSYFIGVRPGKDTENKIKEELGIVSRKNALFLIAIGVLPMLLPHLTSGAISTPQAFGGTSIIIMVSLIQEVFRELSNTASAQYYKKNSSKLFYSKKRRA